MIRRRAFLRGTIAVATASTLGAKPVRGMATGLA